MGWLLDNSLADMRGTDFLIFYGIVACIVIAGAYFFVAAQDTTGQAPPPTPSVVDPYELAYLRGGVHEVVRTAIYALRQKGLIEIAEKTRLRATGFSAPELGGIERRAFEAIRPAPTIAALFKDQLLASAVESLCGAYKQRLSAQRLLAAPDVRRAGYRAIGVAAALLLALAGYKTWAALAHGHSNLGFLFMEAAASCVALVWILRKTTGGNASRRGRAFLSQVQLAYSGRLGAVFGASDGGAGRDATSGAALAMVGLFGFAILKGTPDAALAQAFARSSGTDGGCGSGGGGGDGGGGGCGGCGGGGD